MNYLAVAEGWMLEAPGLTRGRVIPGACLGGAHRHHHLTAAGQVTLGRLAPDQWPVAGGAGPAGALLPTHSAEI